MYHEQYGCTSTHKSIHPRWGKSLGKQRARQGSVVGLTAPLLGKCAPPGAYLAPPGARQWLARKGARRRRGCKVRAHRRAPGGGAVNPTQLLTYGEIPPSLGGISSLGNTNTPKEDPHTTVHI
ncbi:hypothetical protein PCANC_06184 [Puccinia coronata f. sp. avenae]|uniref:Uncharacterized protein n=1 Tax=Puccinia coronata f. sp. avenae TaxID=200324 RepID=A0A2N5VTF9_9BASI|nr:hypothetical protein PCANC_06184 [Puccinia coronata f. sp. avenae]